MILCFLKIISSKTPKEKGCSDCVCSDTAGRSVLNSYFLLDSVKLKKNLVQKKTGKDDSLER